MAEPHLRRGEKIPGSRYFRNYCCECNAAIRVSTFVEKSKPFCANCRPSFGVENSPMDGTHVDALPRAHEARPEAIKVKMGKTQS